MSESFIVAPVVNTVVINDECAICLECINPRKNCCVTDCGHKFHTNCLLKNCEKNNFNCPMCRHVMVESINNIHNAHNIPSNIDEAESLARIEDDLMLMMMARSFVNAIRSSDIVERRTRAGLVDTIVANPPSNTP
jgi:hypothetical protein